MNKMKIILPVLVLAVFIVSALFVSAGDLTISISPAAGAGNPAESVSYVLTVGNTGTTDMASVVFSATALIYDSGSISAPSLTTITNLTAGSTQTQTFTISIPSTPAGTYSGSITATDSDNAANTATVSYTLEVYSKSDFSTSVSSISITAPADETETKDITVTNTGSANLTSWSISYSGDTEDNDGDEINFAFSGLADSDVLAPGESRTLTVTIEIDNNVDAGSYDGTITIASGTAVSKTVSSYITVEPEICEKGEQGTDLSVRIREPDSGDDVDVGTSLIIEVEVENDGDEDLDVVIEAILYNVDEDEIAAREELDATEITEDDEELFEFSFDVPGDIDEDDDYYLYVKAYEDDNEEDLCTYERVSIDLGRPRHAVELTASVSPSEVTCGDKFTVTAEAKNVGRGDEDAVWFKIISSYLGINTESATFDLDDYDSDDDERKETFSFTVPDGTTAKDYYLNVYVYYDDGDEYSDTSLKLTVTDCIAPEPQTKLVVDATSYTAEIGSTITIPVVVENIGDEALTYTLSTEDITWGEITGIEQAGTVQAGSTSHAYIYVKPSTAGEYMITITLTDENGDTDTEVVTITATEAEAGEWFTGWATGIGSDSQKMLWLGLDILLVIVVIILIVGLFRKKRGSPL